MALFSTPRDSDKSDTAVPAYVPLASAPSRPAATIIAKGVKVDGDFGSDGDVVIDGEVKGSLSATGQLTVGTEAVIHADVKAGSAIVSGTVEGNLTADKRIDLKSTARIKGDLVSETLSVESGARIDGKLSIGGKTQSA
ncbi:polymer-forming cytoskeletal protein [Candidatus Uhrbacteria bacterium]|nr:polymer-forming cytoskeletal protein [Candidatus Uhrbacteria bacterium]